MRSTLIASLAAVGLASACQSPEPVVTPPGLGIMAVEDGPGPEQAPPEAPPSASEEPAPTAEQAEPPQEPAFGYALAMPDNRCMSVDFFRSSAPDVCALRGAQLAHFEARGTEACPEGGATWAYVGCGAPLPRLSREEMLRGASWSRVGDPSGGDESACRTMAEWRALEESEVRQSCGPYFQLSAVVPIGSELCGGVLGDGPWSDEQRFIGVTYHCGAPLTRSAEGTTFHARSVGTPGTCAPHGSLQEAAVRACAEEGATLTQVVPIASASCAEGESTYAWAGCASNVTEPGTSVHRVGTEGVCKTRAALKAELYAQELCENEGGWLSRLELVPNDACPDGEGFYAWATCSLPETDGSP